jgi:hypothetical protein
MESRNISVAKRLALALAGAALSGCAYYGPPYAAYDGAPVSAPYYYYPYSYGGPVYVGPPLSLSFGYYEHRYGGGYGYRGGHGWRGSGWDGHGWGGRGWGGHGFGGRGWGGGGWHGRH